MDDQNVVVWLQMVKTKVGTGDRTGALDLINELEDKLRKKIEAKGK